MSVVTIAVVIVAATAAAVTHWLIVRQGVSYSVALGAALVVFGVLTAVGPGAWGV